MITSSQNHRAARQMILSAAVGALMSSAQGAQYLMDFNAHTGGTSSHPGGEAAWNVYAAPGDINNGLIKDTSGSTLAGLRLDKTGTITDSSNTGTAAFDNPTGGPSWVTNNGSLGNTGAAADYFYTSLTPGSQSFTMMLSGLAPGSIVSLDLFFSRANANSGNGNFSYSLDGGNSWLGLNVLEKDGSAATTNGWGTNTTLSAVFRGQADGNDLGRYMNSGEVVIGNSGTIQFRTQDDAVAGWSGINAARLTVIPEPSSALIVAGAALFGALRRRRVA